MPSVGNDNIDSKSKRQLDSRIGRHFNTEISDNPCDHAVGQAEVNLYLIVIGEIQYSTMVFEVSHAIQ